MSQDDEPSVLEYARFYGLTVNYLATCPIQQCIRDLDRIESDDEPMLLEAEGSPAQIQNERILIPKNALALLSNVTTAQGQVLHDGLPLPKIHRSRDMKVELPLLRTDPEVDMQDHPHRVMPELAKELIPLEKVEDGKDESLQWSGCSHSLPAKVNAKLASELLTISKDTILYLQEVSGRHETRCEAFKLETNLNPDRLSTIWEPVTPPLMPMYPEFSLWIPSSEAGYLEFLSDRTSPAVDELLRIDRHLMVRDAMGVTRRTPRQDNQDSDGPLLDSDALGKIYSPLKDWKEPPSPDNGQRRPMDLKVDGPLTPLLLDGSPPMVAKDASFSKAPHGIVPDLSLIAGNKEQTLSDDIECLFAESFEPIAEAVDKRINQEQLEDVGVAMRVRVPVIECPRPSGPWKVSAGLEKSGNKGNDRGRFLHEMKRGYISGSFWPAPEGVDRLLRWAPFPKELAKVATQDQIKDDVCLMGFVSEAECVNHDCPIWDPARPGTLHECGSDYEDIEEGHFPDIADLNTLLRKRKLDLVEVTEDKQIHEPKRPAREGHTESEKRMESQAEALLGRSFSAIAALENFIDIRCGKERQSKLELSRYFPSNATEPVKQVFSESESTTPSTLLPTYRSSPWSVLPELIVPSVVQPFIISSSLLSNRSLTRKLRAIYPSANFIERDFNLHDVAVKLSSFSSENSLHCTSSRSLPQIGRANEADLLVAPSTALMITTLQRTKQLSLPGTQPSLPALQSRILAVTPRYEHVILLISQNSSAEPQAVLTAADVQALNSLYGFCTSLAHVTTVEVVFVPGGEDEITLWIVSLMVRYAGWNGREDFSLLPEETLWEVWLRRAGMNAFAAQVVLGMLKAPSKWIAPDHMKYHDDILDRDDNDLTQDKGEWGLGMFVRMGLVERYKRFASILGGKRLLRRVSEVIDALW